ncbi:MAG TPA: phosphoribosyltransferase family protein [Flavobacteriales bacterium]|nr:phosphoribosyltransferase [Flavobacteriales bacterium]HRN38283.1 phosphoribosyltransferase family protein [Flavobacteriales bacterium]HRO40715.1 phosphoribosyltransferase family protein [Flavobacteriales bacterium]HRP82913.1 phosphoribosyltransferase family protein [Flavobacteriales bacterium]HRQ85150.1 phosphoribosyltransferase family protein [Flavobacteriales bacterium]
MAGERTLVLEHERIQRKLRRIAIQVYEENVNEPGLVLVGIAPRGAKLAARLKAHLEEISPLAVDLHELVLDKDAPVKSMAHLAHGTVDLNGRVVVLVDDVLMSGRTLMYAAAHLITSPLKRLTTVVLVDRRHRSFPIRADIVGLTLTTTLQEHISVVFGKKDAVYLS